MAASSITLRACFYCTPESSITERARARALTVWAAAAQAARVAPVVRTWATQGGVMPLSSGIVHHRAGQGEGTDCVGASGAQGGG
ncbi:hypothetical protein, partial [Chloroflexus sp.]|uniref:hypothetical protein n=1 Tax=Chloroflexus sp. TaxID=1904827 RepID=UPI003D105AFC